MSHNGLRAVIAALLADRFPLSTGRKQNSIDSAICDLHGPKLTLAGTGEGGGGRCNTLVRLSIMAGEALSGLS